jgi:hypothetical protein
VRPERLDLANVDEAAEARVQMQRPGLMTLHDPHPRDLDPSRP